MPKLTRRAVTSGAAALLTAPLLPTRAASAPSGTLTVAMPSFSEGTFLPWNGGASRKFYLDALYDYLVYLDPKTRALTPGLAESWTTSPDGKTIQLSLRKGVPFHGDAGMLGAEDVKFSLDRIRDPKATAGPSSNLRNAIESVEASGPLEVIIRLKQPDIDFVRGYLTNALQVAMVSKAWFDRVGEEGANARPVGTGPYVLDEARKDVSIRLRVAPNVATHWRNPAPAFESLSFLAAPEQSTRVAMLRAGEVDLTPVSYDSIATLKAAGLGILSVPRTWAPVIRLGGLAPKFKNDRVPWAKTAVRQALNLAIDKEAIVKEIFQGEGAVATLDFPAPEFDGLPAYPYDPARAKRLLAEAGYPNGFDVELRSFAASPGAELPIIAEAVALYWQAIGVRAKIAATDWASLRSAWINGKTTDVAWVHRGFPFSTPLTGIEAGHSSSSVFASYASPELDTMISAIKTALDPKERAAATAAVGKALNEAAGDIYIAVVNETYGASRKVGAWPSLSEQVTNIDLITRR